MVPLFAFANAGVVLEGGLQTLTTSTVALGIIFGLVLGKAIGISFFSWILLKLNWAEMPEKSNWRQIIGVAFLAGIGFTMSLFISELAFESKELIAQSKLAVLAASSLAALIGLGLLRMNKAKA